MIPWLLVQIGGTAAVTLLTPEADWICDVPADDWTVIVPADDWTVIG